MQIQKVFGALTIVMLALSACGEQDAPVADTPPTTIAPATAVPAMTVPVATTEPTEGEATDNTSAMADAPAAEAAATEEAAAEPTVEVSVRPAWQSLPLINAQTGESFTLADFAGKTVFVEPFATWCTNCRQQLTNVNQVRANFGDDVIFIALSVEPNIGNEALAQYASDQGFDMIFAAMSPDLLREVVALLGQTITNPPATPHFIIRADGSTTELFTGIEDPETITALIQSAKG